MKRHHASDKKVAEHASPAEKDTLRILCENMKLMGVVAAYEVKLALKPNQREPEKVKLPWKPARICGNLAIFGRFGMLEALKDYQDSLEVQALRSAGLWMP